MPVHLDSHTSRVLLRDASELQTIFDNRKVQETRVTRQTSRAFSRLSPLDQSLCLLYSVTDLVSDETRVEEREQTYRFLVFIFLRAFLPHSLQEIPRIIRFDSRRDSMPQIDDPTSLYSLLRNRQEPIWTPSQPPYFLFDRRLSSQQD